MSSQIALAHPDRLFIGGDWIVPKSTAKLRLFNPSNEEMLFEVAEAGPDEVDLAVAAARKAFDQGPWPRMTPAERATMMRKLGAVLERRCAELDAAWIGQVGVPVSMARGSGIGASMLLSYYADLAEKTVFEDVRPSQGFVCGRREGTSWRCGCRESLERAADGHVYEGCPGACCRLHDRDEAIARNPA